MEPIRNNFLICNLCDAPGHFDDSSDVTTVASNVRKFKDQMFTVWRCRNCRSIHSKEKVDLDFYYKHYPLQKQRLTYAYWCDYYQRLQFLLRLGLNKNSRILDMGCGSGLFVSFLKSRGYANSSGYDAYSKKFSDKEILSKNYDFIVALDLIEHVDDPRGLMLNLRSSLNKGGILVISTPKGDDIDLSSPDSFSRELHQPYHRHILSEQALRNLGEKSGLIFQGLENRPFFDTLFPGVNQRFIWGYARRMGNLVDVFVENFAYTKVLFSIDLLFFFWFGYFFPRKGNMTVTFKLPN